jgi:5-formyltetrahydrofolate cyclo-ligase
MTGEMAVAKHRLRAEILAARTLRPGPAREAAGEAIATHALQAWPAVRRVAAYLSTGTEPRTQQLLEQLTLRGVKVILPVIVGDRLDWAQYVAAGAVATGQLGISEPTGDRLGADALAGVDLVLVPALAADHAGNRLGRGRGYYDRALQQVTSTIFAVIYDDELVATVPSEPHDHPVDGVLRPSGVSTFGR